MVNRNIVILPNPEIAAQSTTLSNFLRDKVETNFTLDRTKYFPHITMHQWAMPKANDAELLHVMQEVAANHQPFEVQLTSFSIFAGSGIFWVAELSVPLQQLHKAIVQAVEPLREGYIMAQHAGFLTGETLDIGPERRKSLGYYGNPLAMETYEPHITLTACKSEEDAQQAISELHQLRSTTGQFTVTHIHITGVGPYGTCPGSQQEIKLGA